MTDSLEYAALLRLIDERSAAFRSAVAAGASLDAPVPSCPEWTLFDLVRHLGTGQRWWAAIVAAGPAEAPPAKNTAGVPRELEALLAWYAESNELLLSALREAGPERECWTWWGAGLSPANAWGVARRRVHEVLVHTYDAQLAAGTVQPMPPDVAIDGVAEFLDTCNSTPGRLAARGRHHPLPRHRGPLLAPGARRHRGLARTPHGQRRDPLRFGHGHGRATAPLRLCRLTLSDLKTEGDQQVFERLIAWEPEE